jgi:hypothetical protein
VTDKQEKLLRPKYLVSKILSPTTGGLDVALPMQSTDPNNVDSPFVLMPRKDPAAFAALVYYAQVCEPQLAQEIAEWLDKIAHAEPVFGTQGMRNFASVRIDAVHEIRVTR